MEFERVIDGDAEGEEVHDCSAREFRGVQNIALAIRMALPLLAKLETSFRASGQTESADAVGEVRMILERGIK